MVTISYKDDSQASGRLITAKLMQQITPNRRQGQGKIPQTEGKGKGRHPKQKAKAKAGTPNRRQRQGQTGGVVHCKKATATPTQCLC